MELSWLVTFIEAAQCGNFRKAAEKLYISQPSVTVHIQQLEKSIGVPLFERQGKRVKLTEAGKRYVEHAKQLLAVYKEGLQDLSSFSQGYSDKLTLAISPLIADTVLPFVLKKYTKEHPEMEISVVIVESPLIEQSVEREEADIGLSCLPASNPQLVTELLSQEKVVFVTGHDGKDSESAPPFDEEELLTTHYLFTHNHPSYWDALTRQLTAQFPVIRMMKVSQVHITKRFIAEGLGVSFLPASTVRRELLEGRLVEVHCQKIQLPTVGTYAITKYKHTKHEEFLSFLAHYRM
ncbi:transcriptional regulator CitR [Fictibacillus macauensis ZFHKF-1]|uniref:Transcriptional regulator CitR n=1 Tax=Fictibacillus macauensis ZFHKF-1 TaxID=1196324 RepID=I8UJJ9_9BACL|nr:LysR family transcriptional regulator [Fictibacillus macauensis]EIT86983.1 transcriptional regulator CitR [Fictibacillus macauensis ZFHKF-1]